ncbi:hypothetical protein LWF01_11125 [Saxibacter everestensis]|uniref:SAF domain-containing protein n=1 Tax=Saxibacter everestensis TaxID=2909229 RepID=A0ABY8QP56_9MICO|nr:hypothetical protein LWF01_11125 [Brevibacteriaceae bacterium ZFBP1038]
MAVARRLKQPSWRDARLLIGILLVAAAVSATWQLVRVASDTITVYAAAETLVPGQKISTDQLEKIQVKLPENAEKYVSANRDWGAGIVALRPIYPGELIPREALGNASELEGRMLAINLESSLPDGVRPGSRVDVWATPRDGAGTDQMAKDSRLVLEAVTVLASGGLDNALGSDGQSRIELFVPSPDLPELIQVLGRDERISIVALPGSKSP